jgi:hypothetical protein
LGSIGYVNLTILVPAKPVGNQVDILLTLAGNAGTSGSLSTQVYLTLDFIDVVSPAPPISEAIFLVFLIIISSVAVGFFVVRWQKFLFLSHRPRHLPGKLGRIEEDL